VRAAQGITSKWEDESDPYLATSPTDTRNGLLVCELCDVPYERHDIEIDSKGKIHIADTWLNRLSGAKKTKYKKLKNTHVPWKAKINTGTYPTAAILMWRMTLPYVKSKEGRRLIKEFNAEAKRRGRHPNLSSDDEDEESGTEDSEEDEEEEPAQKKKKTAAGSSSFSSIAPSPPPAHPDWICGKCNHKNKGNQPRCRGTPAAASGELACSGKRADAGNKL
jgi:hypothetical protein